MRTTEVSFEQFTAIDFEDPAVWYIRTALSYVYIHCKTRKQALEWVKENYDGKYTVRASKNVTSTPHYDGFSVTAR